MNNIILNVLRMEEEEKSILLILITCASNDGRLYKRWRLKYFHSSATSTFFLLFIAALQGNEYFGTAQVKMLRIGYKCTI